MVPMIFFVILFYMFERLKKTTRALIYGRDGISPNVDKFMRDHGDEPILEMIISRNVVSSILTGSMKLISTQFREGVGSNKLYHLKLLIRTTHSNISLEKNEVITISPYQMNYKAENMYVHFPPGITINIILQNTRNKMGNSFLTYSARDNNCQNFVLSLLEANGLSNSQNVLFTKQSTSALFSTEMRKLTNTITDIAQKVDIIREGGSLLC